MPMVKSYWLFSKNGANFCNLIKFKNLKPCETR